MLKTLGADSIFIMTACMFLASAALATQVRASQEEAPPRVSQGAVFSGVLSDFRESWRILFSDRYSTVALLQLITSGTLVLIFSILIPRYMQDVIGAPPENAAFVFAPTGIGALVGLRFLPWFAKFGKNRVVVIGLTGIAVCLVLLALVEPLAEITEQAPGSDLIIRQLQLSLLQALTMLIAGPMGFCYALLNAPAQTVLHERAPPEMRGRIFATQVVSANFISLLPLLVIGAATDLVKVPAVLIMIAAVVAGVAFLSARVPAREEQEAEERRPRDPPRERQEVGAGRFTESESGPDPRAGEL
jgi:MFS family permease